MSIASKLALLQQTKQVQKELLGINDSVPWSKYYLYMARWLLSDLFKSGKKGFWYDPIDTTTLFKDAAGVSPVTADGDPVGLMLDKSGNGYHAKQTVSAARPTYQPTGLLLDKVDDALTVYIDEPIVGTQVIVTDSGVLTLGVTIPKGNFNIGMYIPGNSLLGFLIIADKMTVLDEKRTVNHFVDKGANESLVSFNFRDYFKDWPHVTSFPEIDTSRVTNFSFTWAGCSGLTSFPLLNIDRTTNLSSTWRDCSSLTSFPLMDTSNISAFQHTWYGCSGLTSFPLIDTRKSTNISYAWYGCSSLISFPAIDTSNIINISYAWYGCSNLTSFPSLSTSKVVNFSYAWRGCSSLTSFPAIDTSSATTFSYAWFGCSSLTSFPPDVFNNIKAGAFSGAFSDTNLDQQSIDNILVSLVASGVSKGTRLFSQSGGSEPSAVGKAAIDTLRSRGWTVSVTGGY